MLGNALIVFLVTTIARMGVWFFPMILIDRPIFVGFLIGLVLGDVKTGILVGAQLELVFMGIVTVGADTPADGLTSTAITASFAILNGMPIETVIPIGVTLGYAGALFSPVCFLIDELFVPVVEKYLHKDDERMFNIVVMIGAFIARLVPGIIAAIAVYFGGDLVTAMIDHAPEFILNGIGAAGAMLPALGLAMLTSLLWNKKAAIYFFVGFFIVKYLAVDTTFILVIALLFALTNFYNSAQNNKQAVEIPKSEEEAFFE